jgi:hypothetical protein
MVNPASQHRLTRVQAWLAKSFVSQRSVKKVHVGIISACYLKPSPFLILQVFTDCFPFASSNWYPFCAIFRRLVVQSVPLQQHWGEKNRLARIDLYMTTRSSFTPRFLDLISLGLKPQFTKRHVYVERTFIRNLECFSCSKIECYARNLGV